MVYGYKWQQNNIGKKLLWEWGMLFEVTKYSVVVR